MKAQQIRGKPLKAKPKTKAKAASATPGTGIAIFWAMVFTGLGIVFIPPTMLVVFAGLIPSLVAILLNTGRIGSVATMLAFNIAGILPVVGILWERGQTFSEAFRLLSDVYMWLAMFGGAGIGMFLSWALPIVVFSVYELRAKAAISRLQKRRAKLVEEWGGQFIADIREVAGSDR